MKPNLLELTLERLRQAVVDAGQPAYRADQLADWVYRKGVTDAAAMTNLPRGLVEGFDILTSRVAVRRESRDGVIKLLLEYRDRERIETVLIPGDSRATACLSTQVGCAFGCTFCASGLNGLARNLKTGEILEQLLHLRQAAGRRITNVVFMGMGEPLANYSSTLEAIRAIVDPDRFGISARSVVLSTIGLPEAIRRLAREGLPITLAISLHAPTEALRRKLMPAAAKAAPLENVLAAAETFFQSRNREITLEYVLLEGANDDIACAEALIGIAHRLRANVNLIRYNPVERIPPTTAKAAPRASCRPYGCYEPPSPQAAAGFLARLRRRGVNAHLRRSRGADIAAACGQLRRIDAP
jgi:23S rRNA (adenine2503-C2)-methyltransferase